MSATESPDTDEDDKPPTKFDQSKYTGTLKYELGRVALEHHGDLPAVEMYCYTESRLESDDLRPKDWLFPVYVSKGRVVLRCDMAPEAAFIAYDGSSLRALIWNNVFLEHREMEVDKEDVEELIGKAEGVKLLPRHKSRFDSEQEEKDA